MDRWFVDRLFAVMLAQTYFIVDDITDRGRYAVDPTHATNGGQNKIGAWIRTAHAQGWIIDTGRTELTRAPHGRGRKVTVWTASDRGRRLAEAARSTAMS